MNYDVLVVGSGPAGLAAAVAARGRDKSVLVVGNPWQESPLARAEQVDNYLHKHPDVAEVLLQKIQESEKERKAIAGVTKIARERAKKANLHNRKLRDCRIHLNDQKGGKKEEDDPRLESSIFITCLLYTSPSPRDA